MSPAIIRPAPAIAGPWTAVRPTPPQPISATVEPGATFAVLNTAPTPVVTPQPISAARSSGMSLRIFTIAFSCTSICSAYEDRSRNCHTGVPSLDSRCGSVNGRRVSVFAHSEGRPDRQNSQCPQNTDRQVIT